MENAAIEFLDRLREESRKAFVPVMRKETTKLLFDLVSEKKPKKVLEIGTGYGVSGITALLAGAEFITTVDIDGDAIEKAKINYASCGVRERAEFIEGDCEEILNYMDGNVYDFIIMDGPKSKYLSLYEKILSITAKGGTVFYDDVDFFGLAEEENPERKHRTNIKSLQKFRQTAENDTRVNARFYHVENGVAVITVKG